MIIQTKNQKEILLRKLGWDEYAALYDYFQQFSPELRKRFGAHFFDLQSIIDFYKTSSHLGYVADEVSTSKIIGYAIIKLGFLKHDQERLESYGLSLSSTTDCIYAPSVTDRWQGLGVGYNLFRFVVTEMRKMKIERMILWGGVQSDNKQAIDFYQKIGFKKIGEFEHQGLNYDMILTLD